MLYYFYAYVKNKNVKDEKYDEFFTLNSFNGFNIRYNFRF